MFSCRFQQSQSHVPLIHRATFLSSLRTIFRVPPAQKPRSSVLRQFSRFFLKPLSSLPLSLWDGFCIGYIPAFLPFHKPKPPNRLRSSSNPITLTSNKTRKPSSRTFITAHVSSNHETSPSNGSNREYPFARTLKTTAGTLVLTVAVTLMSAKFKCMPSKAEPSAPKVETVTVEEETSSESRENPCESVESLKALQQKLDIGEDEEALKILGKLVEAQPTEMEWKFLMARLLSELGKTQEASGVFEEILAVNLLNFEALSGNALLMDQCGEGDGVIARLEKALRIAEDENTTTEARDVRLIMAQIKFLQKIIDEALQSFEELSKEDPKDYRPYFRKGIIYSLLDQEAKARQEFAKYTKNLMFKISEGPDFRRCSSLVLGTECEN